MNAVAAVLWARGSGHIWSSEESRRMMGTTNSSAVRSHHSHFFFLFLDFFHHVSLPRGEYLLGLMRNYPFILVH
jgi:hypothetical protein